MQRAPEALRTEDIGWKKEHNVLFRLLLPFLVSKKENMGMIVRFWQVLCGLVLLSIVVGGCSSDDAFDDLERGTFVITLQGAVEDTVRGQAYVRRSGSKVLGVELDADSMGWSIAWEPHEVQQAPYQVAHQSLIEQAVADRVLYDDERSVEDSLKWVAVFMQHPRGAYQGTRGIVQPETADGPDLSGILDVELSPDLGSDANVSMKGAWHAVEAPHELPPHLHPED